MDGDMLMFNSFQKYLLKKHAKRSLNIWNIYKLRQKGPHFPDDIFKCMFLNESVWILIKISLNLIPRGPVSDIPALI